MLLWFKMNATQKATFGHFIPRTGGSVGGTLGCHAGGREFDSGRTNTHDQVLKITEQKVLPL